MTEYNVELDKLVARGHTVTELRDGVFCMTVTRANPLGHCKPGIKCNHYAEIPASGGLPPGNDDTLPARDGAAPGRFRLPLRIDITAKIDVPSFYIMLGEGHVNIGDYFGNRRIDDICEPQNKINFYDSRIPMGEFADIAIIYGLKEMQVLINGEERYYSKREKYMKSKALKAMNDEGLTLWISCDKRVNLEVKGVRITEFGEHDYTGIEHNADPPEDRFVPPAVKPGFKECIARLPDRLRAAIADMDGWLRAVQPKGAQGRIKFKRQIGKYGDKITYVASENGFSYAVHISGEVMYHTLQWYILTQGKAETWGRKADQMEETLARLALNDPAFAKRMFNNLHDCVGGYGSGCLAKSPYTYDGKKTVACHGMMYFNMNLPEFEDVRRFIGAICKIAGQ